MNTHGHRTPPQRSASALTTQSLMAPQSRPSSARARQAALTQRLQVNVHEGRDHARHAPHANGHGMKAFFFRSQATARSYATPSSSSPSAPFLSSESFLEIPLNEMDTTNFTLKSKFLLAWNFFLAGLQIGPPARKGGAPSTLFSDEHARGHIRRCAELDGACAALMLRFPQQIKSPGLSGCPSRQKAVAILPSSDAVMWKSNGR